MKTLTIIMCGLLWAAIINAQIIHVPADQPTIQAGIYAATTGDTVLVADGTYLENINFMGKAITVASHFIMDADTNHINNTIIDGSQPANPDYGSVVTFITAEDTTSVIKGFTITGGTGIVEPVNSIRMGGGIACYMSGAKIIYNKITGNSVTAEIDAYGGGIVSYNYENNQLTILENNSIYDNYSEANAMAAGGGMFISGHAIITNNIITDNHCNSPNGDAEGGGVHFYTWNTPPDKLQLTGNTINNNSVTTQNFASSILTRGGGAAVFNAQVTIKGNSFDNNYLSGSESNGVGLLLYNTLDALVKNNSFNYNTVNPVSSWWGTGCMCVSPQGSICFEENDFSFNSGPDIGYGVGTGLNIIWAYDNEVIVRNNTFRSNTNYWFAGGLYTRSCYNQFVANNLFDGNYSRSGGAVGMNMPANKSFNVPVYSNNTFVNNSTFFRGGAIHLDCETNVPQFYNSIFNNNASPSASNISYVGSTEDFVISYSNLDVNQISGPWTGIGNINADPLFDLSGPHPYALMPNSPCIDTGTPDTTGLNLPPCDIMGCVRIWDGDGDGIAVIDMGAYEFGAPLFVGIPQSEIENRKSEITVYPNPFHSSINIEFELLAKAQVTLQVYNHLGQMVAELANETREAGIHRISWDSSNLPTGLYYCRLVAGMKNYSCKIIKNQ
jgi:hypothetical protein